MIKIKLAHSPIYKLIDFCKSYVAWRKRGYASPSPHLIKQACILRCGWSDAVWVETGTYLGQTTALLAKHAKKVYSIEPEPTLHRAAATFFSKTRNVEIINGLSETVFPKLLPTIDGDVNFWLDGHYSAGMTHKGPQDTPILDELKCISENLTHFGRVCVLVDDVRCFSAKNDDYSSYPSLDALVNWANVNKMEWHIEHDIFVATR